MVSEHWVLGRLKLWFEVILGVRVSCLGCFRFVAFWVLISPWF